jgi:superfamily II DNA or RNA helicase
MTITPYPHQINLISQLAAKLQAGIKRLVVQMATGGGKTVTFALISQKFIENNPDYSVLIIVDRKELLEQARRTLWELCRINAQPITKGMRHVPKSQVYIAMVESLKKRMPEQVGLVIIDEAHTGNFRKVMDWYKGHVILGFTATPLSSNKKHPMNKDYEDIVCAIDTPELIGNGTLCQNITFAPADAVNRKELTVKGGDYDEGLMGMQFSQPKYVKNTRLAYEKYAAGTKAIIFNVNIAHSLLVTQEFQSMGYQVCHLDGETSDIERKRILQWFKETPQSILCNVGIATKGFDEPSIETVIVNRSTMSLVLWLQMCGRGSRTLEWKKMFRIIDLGGNAITHGDWSQARDWQNIFLNPPKASDGNGVAPVKNCPKCDAIIAAQARTCKHCGFEIPKSTEEEELEELLGDFVVFANGVDPKKLIEEQEHRKKYYSFFQIGKLLAAEAKRIVPKMTDEIYFHILEQNLLKGAEWCEAHGIKWNKWHQERIEESLKVEIEKKFKIIIEKSLQISK